MLRTFSNLRFGLIGLAALSQLCFQQMVCNALDPDVRTILESACLSCHHGEDAEGGLRLDSLAHLNASDSALVPGKPQESSLYTTTLLPADDDLAMPPDGPRLSILQTERLRKWIESGAEWSDEAVLTVQPRIVFPKDIQPILEQNCVSCHQPSNLEGDYDLTRFETAAHSSGETPGITPFRPQASRLHQLVSVPEDDAELMPPTDSGGPLSKQQIEKIRLWIAQGAVWPEGTTLEPKAKQAPESSTPDNLELVKRLRVKILEQSKVDSAAEMKNYQQTVPRSGATYEMVAIQGGTFQMGSPEDEADRQAIEGPQTKVSIEPFWMGKFEVTWDEYEPFMITKVDRHKDGSRMDYDATVHTDIDAVSGPTAPYIEMSFGMGQSGYPAISMTQHAANKYCQWLSAQTGHFYRLPTEAEWEYACRAGSKSAYHFGDDPKMLGKYAWFYDNSNEKYQKVGKKQPNAWGLYDMHGNVSEWTADQFYTDYFSRLSGQKSNPYLLPTTRYPRSVRGGSWFDDPDRLRSAARLGSDPIWKQQDPQLPKSIWYHTDAQWLGFRLVRPLKVPDAEQMDHFWNSAAKK